MRESLNPCPSCWNKREQIRLKHYSIRTEQAYLHWVRDYILFHKMRHPKETGKNEVIEFLTHLAVKRKVAASTQNQALSALLFLYSEVLQQPFDWLEHVERAKWRGRNGSWPACCTVRAFGSWM